MTKITKSVIISIRENCYDRQRKEIDMKTCINCGKPNKDDNIYCSGCGGTEFEEITGPEFPDKPPMAPPPIYPGDMQRPTMPPPPVQPPLTMPVMPKPQRAPFTIFDVLTILGFVSSIVGLVSVWVVFEPMAIIASVLGFVKGSHAKGLAIAGIIIAVVAFIIRLFNALYDGNVIGRWAIEGIFH